MRTALARAEVSHHGSGAGRWRSALAPGLALGLGAGVGATRWPTIFYDSQVDSCHRRRSPMAKKSRKKKARKKSAANHGKRPNS
jgi:hypothetical protein